MIFFPERHKSLTLTSISDRDNVCVHASFLNSSRLLLTSAVGKADRRLMLLRLCGRVSRF